ncbi:plasmid mobilization protein [Xanthobacter sp. TB0139]|uniref:plasmid mobilization protein n=1 Tax=Xanthobacter sp. TB0139 TaxID=3459178 RepID=UPI004039FA7A
MTAGHETIMSCEERARRPLSYAGASDREPCEGRQASPSNPTATGKARAKEVRAETFVFRCTRVEKDRLRDQAALAGLSSATLLREALGLIDARRRKPVPKADPALIRELGRIGGNLNQIARVLNRNALAGGVEGFDAVRVAQALVGIERQLGRLLAEARPC